MGLVRNRNIDASSSATAFVVGEDTALLVGEHSEGSLAWEAPRAITKVRVNPLAPGMTDTEGVAGGR